MQLTTYKVYNRVVHSYLAVFDIEQTGDEDVNIFVCRDLPSNPPIPPAPPVVPQEASSEQQTSSAEMSSPVETSAISPQETSGTLSSYMEDCSSTQEAWSSSVATASSLAETDPSLAEQASSLGEGSSLVVEEASSEESTQPTPLFTVFPSRELVSIASLTDIDVLPLIPTAQGKLYRASTVALIFRSKTYMEQVVAEVMDDVRTNAYIQRIPIEDFEIVELTDPIYGQDEDQVFYFR